MKKGKSPRVISAASLKEPPLNSEERLEIFKRQHQESLKVLREFKEYLRRRGV